MHTMPWILSALIAPLAFGGNPLVETEAQEVCCGLFPAASGELVIEIGPDGDDRYSAGPKMEDIAAQYAALTGQHLVYTDETRSLLQSQGSGLRKSVKVHASEVQSFFEQLLSANQFALKTIRSGSPRMLGIVSLKTQDRNTIRGSAAFIPVEEIGHYAKHAATLITTTVTLPNTDVRQLTNSMRTMITDANTQQMLPAGNTNTILLTGFGSSVAELVVMLRRIDAAAKVERVVPQFEVIRLEFADARHLVGTLGAIIGSGRAKAQGGEGEGASGATAHPSMPNIQMDARTNSLIVAALPMEMALIKALIAQLDVEQ